MPETRYGQLQKLYAIFILEVSSIFVINSPNSRTVRRFRYKTWFSDHYKHYM